MIKTEYLEWDSIFFGKKVARITCCSGVTNDQIGKELLLLREREVDLVYVFTQDDMKLSKGLLGEYNGIFTCEKILYSKKLSYETIDTNINIQPVHEVDQKLLQLAIDSGEYSRFKVDRNFTEGSFERFYKEWIINSLKRKIADEVYIKRKKEQIKGMITLKHKRDFSEIGLIAVEKTCRGEGVGKELMRMAEHDCIKNRILTLNVSTQYENRLACSFYEKNLFTPKRRQNVYHLWLK